MAIAVVAAGNGEVAFPVVAAVETTCFRGVDFVAALVDQVPLSSASHYCRMENENMGNDDDEEEEEIDDVADQKQEEEECNLPRCYGRGNGGGGHDDDYTADVVDEKDDGEEEDPTGTTRNAVAAVAKTIVLRTSLLLPRCYCYCC